VPPSRIAPEAPPAGAFSFLVLAACLAACAPVWARCSADRIDEWVRVRKVSDGDTLRLVDGRRIRLVGLDAPELGRDGRPDEPYAETARAALQAMIGKGRVGLRFDQGRSDGHGRTLAHAFDERGHSLAAELLSRGLATTLFVPPNGWQAQCYAAAEDSAREHGLGRWDLYPPLEAQNLPRDARGVRLVTGRVLRVGESRHSYWLDLAPGVAVRVDKADLRQFGGLVPGELQGRRVRAQGLVLARSRGLAIWVRHPVALAALD
jgi:endonuclease YncB( thermonuclease family)